MNDPASNPHPRRGTFLIPRKIPKLRTCLLALVLLVGMLLITERFLLPTIHTRLGFCPLTFSRYDKTKAIPIVYGLPTWELAEEAKQGRILLGGCILRSTVAVCPHCGLGVEFRDWAAEMKEVPSEKN